MKDQDLPTTPTKSKGIPHVFPPHLYGRRTADVRGSWLVYVWRDKTLHAADTLIVVWKRTLQLRVASIGWVYDIYHKGRLRIIIQILQSMMK